MWEVFGYSCVVPISCFKLVFLRKTIMGCKLLIISLKLVPILNVSTLLFPLYFAALGCMLTKMVLWNLGLQCFKSNIYLGGQLFQFVFFQSSRCNPFQQIFLLGLVDIFCIPWTYALNSECLSENRCADLACK